MGKRTGFFHDEQCLWGVAPGAWNQGTPAGLWTQRLASATPVDPSEAKRRFVSLMHVTGLARKVDIQSAPMASEEDLLRVHSAGYLQAFRALSDDGGGELGDFAPFGAGGYEIARLSAGLAMHAVDGVLAGRYRNAYALCRPGHHCLSSLPMGMCLLANIPIAIEVAKVRHGVKRIAVVDWDVHHGNGTQSIFYRRDDVLTISLHQEGSFPAGYSGARDRGEGAGMGFNINVPLLPGGGHDAYTYAMSRIVAPAIERFQPELILVAAGFGANAVEPVGRMLLHSESFRELTSRMMALADRHCSGALVMVHEGGAAEGCVPWCGHAVVEALCSQASAIDDPLVALVDAQQPNDRLALFQRGLIDEMARAFEL